MLVLTNCEYMRTRRSNYNTVLVQIGLMRNGVLLAEQSPQQLLTEYNCDSLETVFLLLSQQQSVVSIENDEVGRGLTLN